MHGRRYTPICARHSCSRNSAGRLGATRLVTVRRAGRALTIWAVHETAGPMVTRDWLAFWFEIALVCANFEYAYRRRWWRYFDVWIDRAGNFRAPEMRSEPEISVLSGCERGKAGIIRALQTGREPGIAVLSEHNWRKAGNVCALALYMYIQGGPF